jgi:hypothetical protein
MNAPAAVVAALLLGGCSTLHSNYQPGAQLRAAVGRPLVEVAWRSPVVAGGQPVRQLIYLGRSGDTARFALRAVDRDGERHEAQELQYDLARSSTIAAQEMRLEVLEATNEVVIARVLSPSALDAGQEQLTAPDDPAAEPRPLPAKWQ